MAKKISCNFTDLYAKVYLPYKRNSIREVITMDNTLRQHADAIIAASIRAVQPDEAVSRALAGKEFPGRVVLVAAGKAA